MGLARKVRLLLGMMLLCSHLFAQELYQIGFELYRGNSEDFSDIVYCNLQTNGNTGIDNSDLQKFTQFNENLSVYRDTGTYNDFGIESRPLVNCLDTIKLRLYNTTVRTYRIVVDMNLFPATPGLTAVIQDQFLGNERVLKFEDTTVIRFSVASAAASTGLRFRVVLRRNQVQTAPFLLPTICRGKSLNLPEISSNGVKGTWSPALDSNQTADYTFTPSEGQCATVMTATLLVDQPRTPEFNSIGPFIAGQNFSLPATSQNGVQGTWSPAIDNTQTTTYTFTPEPWECATSAQLTVVINQLPTATVEQEKQGKAFGIYPNPVEQGNGIVRVQLNNYPAGQYRLILYSISGISVQETLLQHSGGAVGNYPIRLNEKIGKGVYLMGVQGKQKNNIKKILLVN